MMRAVTSGNRARMQKFIDDCRRLEVHEGGVTAIQTTTRRCIEMGDAIAELEAKLATAVEALRHYAWDEPTDNGSRARAALAQLKEP